jgi:uncharacterized membrane protein YhiD involved in acid resistance
MGDFGLNFFAIITTAGICVIVWALRKLEDRVDALEKNDKQAAKRDDEERRQTQG